MQLYHVRIISKYLKVSVQFQGILWIRVSIKEGAKMQISACRKGQI